MQRAQPTAAAPSTAAFHAGACLTSVSAEVSVLLAAAKIPNGTISGKSAAASLGSNAPLEKSIPCAPKANRGSRIRCPRAKGAASPVASATFETWPRAADPTVGVPQHLILSNFGTLSVTCACTLVLRTRGRTPPPLCLTSTHFRLALCTTFTHFAQKCPKVRKVCSIWRQCA